MANSFVREKHKGSGSGIAIKATIIYKKITIIDLNTDLDFEVSGIEL